MLYPILEVLPEVALDSLMLSVSEEESCSQLRRTNSSGEAYQLEFPRHPPEPLKTDGELDAPLALHKVVNLINNDGIQHPEVLSHPAPREYRLECFGSCDQQIRRVSGLLVPLGERGVPVSDVYRQTELRAPHLQSPQHVSVEGTQGGDVEQRDPLSLILANHPAQEGKDCRLSLPRARWCDYEYVLPLEDQRGGQGLRRCRLFYVRFPQQAPNGLNQVVEARVTAQKRASRGQRPSGLLSDELEEER